MMWPQPSEYIIELLTFEEWLCCDYIYIKSNSACIYNFQHISSQGRFPFERVYIRGKLVLISGEKGGSYLKGYHFVHSLYSPPSAGI